MKVHGIHRSPVDLPNAGKTQGHRPAQHPASRVAVSGEAKALSEARSPAVADAAKVARLAAAIAKGDFMVDAEKIAERMIAEES